MDRSFGLGLGGDKKDADEAVVRAVIYVAHALSLKVIAEGMEREE